MCPCSSMVNVIYYGREIYLYLISIPLSKLRALSLFVPLMRFLLRRMMLYFLRARVWWLPLILTIFW